MSPLIKHLNFIQTISGIIVVAIENQRLFRETLRQEALRRELELAARELSWEGLDAEVLEPEPELAIELEPEPELAIALESEYESELELDPGQHRLGRLPHGLIGFPGSGLHQAPPGRGPEPRQVGVGYLAPRVGLRHEVARLLEHLRDARRNGSRGLRVEGRDRGRVAGRLVAQARGALLVQD